MITVKQEKIEFEWRKIMYTIKQVSEKTSLTDHTIRYYDREGLLPFVTRSTSGIRQFSEDDLEWIQSICHSLPQLSLIYNIHNQMI